MSLAKLSKDLFKEYIKPSTLDKPQLIDLRYTKRSTIFTSNITFDKWSNILGNDEMITKAILDRIIHHSYLFNITGPSYRLKDKLELNQT